MISLTKKRGLTPFAFAVLLAGCATTPPPEPVAVVDTFCLSPASKKRTWDPDTDSIATIREAVVHNRYVDLKCGVPKK